MLVFLLAAALAAVLPGIWRRQAAERRRQRLAAELPQVLDLLALAVSGGLDLYGALAAVAEGQGESLAAVTEGQGESLAAELARVGRQVALGLAPEVALERLAAQSGVPELAALAAAVARARWLGAPLEKALWEQAEALRLHLRHHLEGRLGTLPLRLTLVALVCFLPPLLVLLVLPGTLSLLGGW